MEAMAPRIDGNKLLELRLAQHLTQKQLGDKAGVRNETVNRIERSLELSSEHRNVSRLTARKLADALDVDTSELLTE